MKKHYLLLLLLLLVPKSGLFSQDQTVQDKKDKIVVISDSHNFPIFSSVIENLKNIYGGICIAGDVENNIKDIYKFVEKYPTYPIVFLPGDHDIEAYHEEILGTDLEELSHDNGGIIDNVSNTIDITVSYSLSEIYKKIDLAVRNFVTDYNNNPKISKKIPAGFRYYSLDDNIKNINKVYSDNSIKKVLGRDNIRLYKDLKDSYNKLRGLITLQNFFKSQEVSYLIEKGKIILNIKHEITIKIADESFKIELDENRIPLQSKKIELVGQNIDVFPYLLINSRIGKDKRYLSQLWSGIDDITTVMTMESKDAPLKKALVLSHIPKKTFTNFATDLNKIITSNLVLVNGHTHYAEELKDFEGKARILNPIFVVSDNKEFQFTEIDVTTLAMSYYKRNYLDLISTKARKYLKAKAFLNNTTDDPEKYKLKFIENYLKNLVSQSGELYESDEKQETAVILDKNIMNLNMLPNKGFVSYLELILALPMDNVILIDLHNVNQAELIDFFNKSRSIPELYTEIPKNARYLLTTSLSVKPKPIGSGINMEQKILDLLSCSGIAKLKYLSIISNQIFLLPIYDIINIQVKRRGYFLGSVDRGIYTNQQIEEFFSYKENGRSRDRILDSILTLPTLCGRNVKNMISNIFSLY